MRVQINGIDALSAFGEQVSQNQTLRGGQIAALKLFFRALFKRGMKLPEYDNDVLFSHAVFSPFRSAHLIHNRFPYDCTLQNYFT